MSAPSTIATAPYIELGGLRHATPFIEKVAPRLKHYVSHLLQAKVAFASMPRSFARRHLGIDILANPNRGCYFKGDDQAFIVARRLDSNGNLVSAFGLDIHRAQLRRVDRFLNDFESTATSALSSTDFMQKGPRIDLFGESLIERAIVRHIAVGGYDSMKVHALLEELKRISASVFEGRAFSTGVMVTRSFYRLRRHASDGHFLELAENVHIFPTSGCGKRTWYLADGRNSFFVADKHMRLVSVLFASSVAGAKVDPTNAADLLRGRELLFRSVGHGELSVSCIKGNEFVLKDGRWRLRDLALLADHLTHNGGLPKRIASAVVRLALSLSESRQSSILWIPRDLRKARSMVATEHKLLATEPRIGDGAARGLVLRMATSDGAIVLRRDGRIRSFGALVRPATPTSRTLRGSGESAAQTMSDNGVSLKISQDGDIKLYCHGDLALLC